MKKNTQHNLRGSVFELHLHPRKESPTLVIESPEMFTITEI